MQLYFIRHGQSENNLLWDQTGSDAGRSSDPELTDVGRQQAAHLAAFLAAPGVAGGNSVAASHNLSGFHLTHLYCSPMLRAIETALPVARALGLPLVVWEDLHETGGIFYTDVETQAQIGLPGTTRAGFVARFPELLLPEGDWDSGWWNRPFEPYAERPLRARRVLQTLLERHGDTDDRVAMVSHAGFYNHLLRAILDLPAEAPVWLELQNTAVTRIDFQPEMLPLEPIRLVYTNRVDFLPKSLLT